MSVPRRQALQVLGAGLSFWALGDGCTWTRSPAECEPAPPSDDAGARILAGVETFIVLMMENRSFDHYFGALAFDRDYPGRLIVDGLTGGESNPDADGRPVSVFPLQQLVYPTPPHSWDAAHAQFSDGKNDGFVRANAGPQQDIVMGYYDRSMLPVSYALADRFTVCDRWFASVMGPTYPNRFYLHATTSQGQRENHLKWMGSPLTIWEQLRKRCCSIKNYSAAAVSFYSGGFIDQALGGNDANPGGTIEEFFRAARDGTLPSFCMIDPDYLLNDDKPPHDPQLGQAFIASVVQALANSPQWPRCLLLITYDEHGGFFDHVRPPRMIDPLIEFQQLGFRVPALVIGPTVRSGYVDKTVREHVSVAATLRSRFGIDSLGPRMDAAVDLSSCIDPARFALPLPPPRDLPRLAINERKTLRAICDDTDARRCRSWLRHAADLEAIYLRS